MDEHKREALQDDHQSFMAGVFAEDGFEPNIVRKRTRALRVYRSQTLSN